MSTRVVVLAIGSAMVVAGAAVLTIWPVINVVETGKTPEYPDVVPRQYAASKDVVYDAALRAVGLLPRWTLVSSRREEGCIRVEARTRLLRFVDDIDIRVTERDGATVVNVRSASRIGRGDFGQNARNIRALFDAVDRLVGDRPGRSSARPSR